MGFNLAFKGLIPKLSAKIDGFTKWKGPLLKRIFWCISPHDFVPTDAVHCKSELYSALWSVTPCFLEDRYRRLGDPTTFIRVDGLVIYMATAAGNTNCNLELHNFLLSSLHCTSHVSHVHSPDCIGRDKEICQDWELCYTSKRSRYLGF